MIKRFKDYKLNEGTWEEDTKVKFTACVNFYNGDLRTFLESVYNSYGIKFNDEQISDPRFKKAIEYCVSDALTSVELNGLLQTPDEFEWFIENFMHLDYIHELILETTPEQAGSLKGLLKKSTISKYKDVIDSAEIGLL